MFFNFQKFSTFLYIAVFLAYILSSLDLTQEFRYIFFILTTGLLINFNFNFSKKIFMLSVFIFSLIYLFNTLVDLKFEEKIYGFDKIDNVENVTDKKILLDFYEKNYPICIDNPDLCYETVNQNIDHDFFINDLKKDYKKCIEEPTLCYEKTKKDKNPNLIEDVSYLMSINISDFRELKSNIKYFSDVMPKYNNDKYLPLENYPYFINYSFPKFYNGSKFCYSDVREKEIFQCFKITNERNSFLVLGKGSKLKIELQKQISLKILFLIYNFIFLSFIIIFLKKVIIVKKIPLNIVNFTPLFLIFYLIIISLSNDINFLNTYLFQFPGSDGERYLKFSNQILNSFFNFSFYEFFRGGEDIYWWMPGYRYFIFLEKLIFSNHYYLHLLVLLCLPVMLNNLFKIYFSNKVSNILLTLFLLLPILHHTGFSYYQYIRHFYRLFGEPIGYTFFIFALYNLIQIDLKKIKPSNIYLVTFIFIISCLIRPNLVITVFFLMSYYCITLIIKKEIQRLVIIFLISSPILLPLFHNYYFGNELFLFTRSSFNPVNVKLNYFDYFNYFFGNELSEVKIASIKEIFTTLVHPIEIYKYPLVLFSIISLISLNNNKFIYLKIIFISQFFSILIISPIPRYYWIFWLTCFILSLSFIHTYIYKKLIVK